MSPFLIVTNWPPLILKAFAVLFDQFVPVTVSGEQGRSKTPKRLKMSVNRFSAEEEWLTEKGVLISMERALVGEAWKGGGPIEVPGQTEEGRRLGRAFAKVLKFGMQGDPAEESILRTIAATLDEEDGHHVTTLLPSGGLRENLSSSQIAIFATINMIPESSVDTPWERIIEFRNDPDARRCLISFHRWLRQFADGSHKQKVIAQEIEHLLREYEHYMHVHNIKVQAGTLESVITSTAEVAEDLVKFKWGKLAKALFSVHQRRIALLEAELGAPGREVALIAAARHLFS